MKSGADQRSNELDTGSNSQQSGHFSKKGGLKKATLFAWITLHSIPDETLISPNILHFLEQALEPIPITALIKRQLLRQRPMFLVKTRI
jgi:hypothetical protein